MQRPYLDLQLVPDIPMPAQAEDRGRGDASSAKIARDAWSIANKLAGDKPFAVDVTGTVTLSFVKYASLQCDE